MLISSKQQRLKREPNPALLRVLVVEDHLDTAAVMCRLLWANGFDPRAVSSYKEALHAAAEWIPDVLICDIELPGKDGFEVMKTLRVAYPTLKGLVVSGHAEPEDVERSRAVGFADHLSKPVSPRKLFRAIRELFDANATASQKNA